MGEGARLLRSWPIPGAGEPEREMNGLAAGDDVRSSLPSSCCDGGLRLPAGVILLSEV